jgi:hypothetical protein
MCGEVNEKGWSDEEAIKELDAVFQYFSTEECDVVCDDCYEKFIKNAPLGVKKENRYSAQQPQAGTV